MGGRACFSFVTTKSVQLLVVLSFLSLLLSFSSAHQNSTSFYHDYDLEDGDGKDGAEIIGNYLFSSNSSENSARTGRRGFLGFFPPLSVVRISNIQCTVNGNAGECTTKKGCERNGGTVIGSNSDTCANGLGVCCRYSQTCSGANRKTVSNSGTHLLSMQNYMMPFQCGFTIPRKSGVCQVRLDFVTFSLAGPQSGIGAGDGDCNRDSLRITGADNLSNFGICGNNAGQHLYLHYGASNQIFLDFNLQTLMRMFDVLVTFVKCGPTEGKRSKGRQARRWNDNNNNNKNNDNNDMNMNMNMNNMNMNAMSTTIEQAPPGCSQYFTKAMGQVRTFNYPTATVDPIANNVQSQLNNQKYTVCIKHTPGSSRITWNTCMDAAFSISGSLPSVPTPSSDCPRDFIIIPGGGKDRFCGSMFPGPVSSTLQPYMLYVNFDASETFDPNSLPMNPNTGCCYGCDCVGPNQAPIMPPPSVCDASLDQYCQLPDSLADQTDLSNIGFCLQYAVN